MPNATIVDGKLFGRGTEDMKGNIACFISATNSFLKKYGKNFGGKISFIITGDEEKIVSFEEMLRPFGIIEIMRTGTISLKRGMDIAINSQQPKERRDQSNWEEAASV